MSWNEFIFLLELSSNDFLFENRLTKRCDFRLTDTTVERNALMESVYPKLKDYCRERHGLEFQVVDMRWGVRDEMTDEHMTTVRRNGRNLKEDCSQLRPQALCMNELRGCQKYSMGPNFIYFGAQK